MAQIVIASEDLGVLAVLAAEVAAEGHDVIEVMNGQDALDSVSPNGADLVFLDRSLPIFNGIEVCQMLREDPDLPPSLPIILVTDEDLDSHTRERARITVVLAKTHSMHEVRDLLARYLGAKARG